MKWNAQHIDKTFWVLFIILVVVAFIALLSAGSTLAYAEESILVAFGKQFALLLLGIAVAWGIQMVPSVWIRLGGYFILVVSIICLYLMQLPHSPFAGGANDAIRWFRIGSHNLFQPSELAKLGLTIVIADILSHYQHKEDAGRYFWWTLGITAFTCIPILLGNLSTVILIGVIVLMLWFIARIPGKYIAATIGVVLVVMAIGYTVVEFKYVKNNREIDGRLERATVWVKRVDAVVREAKNKNQTFNAQEALRTSYQRSLAKAAIARGGASPIGVLPGHSQERDYLPLAFMDYIFAIIVEESGLIGAVFLIFIYLAILFRACLVCSKYADVSATLMVMGLALMLTCQALISMAVSVGIGPVTGQPLPLISKGGTSVLITSVYFGIMMAVAREQNQRLDRQHKTLQDSMEDTPVIQLEDDK